MKKFLGFTVVISCTLFFTILIINPVTALNGGSGSNPIPTGVMKIAKKSCVFCHTAPGNGMALAHVNLSNWDKYSPEKQAAKAKAMCKMVTKDKMPPKKFKETHPDGVLTKEEIKTICDWAQSIQVPKK